MENKCIGECYQGEKKALHPMTLEVMKNKDGYRKCPSNIYIDDFTNVRDTIKCNETNAIKYNEIAKYMYIPEVKFNSKSFLHLYDIVSFETGLNWVFENLEKNISRLTILRILNICWKEYHDSVKKISPEMIKCYSLLFTKYSLVKKTSIKDKIIKKSLKKFIKKTTNWNSFNFNSLEIINKYINYYINKK